MTSEPEELKIIVDEVRGTSGDSFSPEIEDSGDSGKFAKLIATATTVGKTFAVVGTALASSMVPLELAIRKSNEFAAKIEANSIQVQLGQVQADLIKLRADREADKLVGRDLKDLIRMQAQQAALYTKMESNLVKAMQPWVQATQELKIEIVGWLVKLSEGLKDMSVAYTETMHQVFDYWITYFQTWSHAEAARIRDFQAETRARQGVEASKRRAFGMFEFVTDLNRAAGMLGNFPNRVPNSEPVDLGRF